MSKNPPRPKLTKSVSTANGVRRRQRILRTRRTRRTPRRRTHRSSAGARIRQEPPARLSNANPDIADTHSIHACTHAHHP